MAKIKLKKIMKEGIKGYWDGHAWSSAEKIKKEFGWDFREAESKTNTWLKDDEIDKWFELVDWADDSSGLKNLIKFLMPKLSKLKRYGIKDKKAIENFAKFMSANMWPKS